MAGKNITAVKELLQQMGFENGLEHALRAKACFLPAHFELFHKMVKGGDTYTFSLRVEKQGDVYRCAYYNAGYRKEIILDDVSVAALETRMKAIDWIKLDNWDSIEIAIADLQILSKTEEGTKLANLLRCKYWLDTPLESMIPNAYFLRSHLEITQRFYLAEGTTPITVEEACRFLQSQWLAKHARKREAAKAPGHAPKARKAPKKKKHKAA